MILSQYSPKIIFQASGRPFSSPKSLNTAPQDAFLQLPEAYELSESDSKAFRTLDARKRKLEVSLMAKKALQDYANLLESESEEEVDICI